MTTSKAAAADLEEWMSEHAGTINAIACASDAAAPLVHLAAVLVKSGLTDEQILGECESVASRFGSHERVETALRRALPLLREASPAQEPHS